jgi:hypothetical protein
MQDQQLLPEAKSAVCAALRALESHDSRADTFLSAADAPFTPELLIEMGGKKFGWLVGGADFPQAEPALWTLAELAVVLHRHDLSPAVRDHLRARLIYTQEVAELYYPLHDGGWNMSPALIPAASAGPASELRLAGSWPLAAMSCLSFVCHSPTRSWRAFGPALRRRRA